MAKRTTFTATDAAGRVHTRTSDRREYTHTVVFLPSFALDMARADRDRGHDGEDWDFACRMVAWGGVFNGVRKPWATDEQIAAELADYTAKASKYTSREEAITGRRAKRVAFVNERKEAGYYATWQNAGWCGRLDLAQKLAARTNDAAKVDVLPAKAEA